MEYKIVIKGWKNGEYLKEEGHFKREKKLGHVQALFNYFTFTIHWQWLHVTFVIIK